VAGQPKVRDLENAFVRDENVCRLHVAVKDVRLAVGLVLSRAVAVQGQLLTSCR